jgi:hypothetical protein
MGYETDDTIELTPEASGEHTKGHELNGHDANGHDTNGHAADLIEARKGDTFKTELTRALQIVAGHERDRLAAAVGAEAARQIERTMTRAVVESNELRRRADDDATAIRSWCEAEIDKIRAEAARRAEEREADLQVVLRRHEAMIDLEVAAVTTAVRQYETTLVEFFDDMTTSMDLAHIARQADLIPVPPNLEVIRADARAATVTQIDETDAEAATDALAGSADGDETSTDDAEASSDGPGVAVMDRDTIWATADVLDAPDETTLEGDETPADADEPALRSDEEAPVAEDTVAAAAMNGMAAHDNPASRFLRSLGLTLGSTDSGGGQPGQPR